jgi:hypothetical protein
MVMGEYPMQETAKLFNFIHACGGSLWLAWSYSLGMPEMAGYSALSPGS